MRVTSRTPWPARPSATSGASARRAATAADVTCGACETSATARSCSAGSTSTALAPHSAISARTAASASAPVFGVGQIAHGRPRKRSARAAAGPEDSRPASGWDGTYAPRSQPSSSAAASGATFTLATSVQTRATPRRWMSATVAATWSGGTATTARSTGSPSFHGRPAPRSAAIETAAGSRSASSTSTPRSRSASATDVPISPVPATPTRRGSASISRLHVTGAALHCAMSSRRACAPRR